MQATPTSQPKDVVSHTKLHRGSAEAARGAHNPEVTGSTPVPGIYHLSDLKKPMVIARATINTSNLHRSGAEEARGTHNPEDLGSSPSSGIYHSPSLQKLVV